MREMVDEMLRLGVFPLPGVNGESFFAERIRIALAQLRKFHFRK